MSRDEVLIIRNLTMTFGGLKALDNINLEVRKGEIVGLIGPNGAGKTTIFNCITGVYKPVDGDIFLHPPVGKARRLNGMAVHKIARLGVARTFQNIRLFSHMTVLENVMVGRHSRGQSGVIGAILRDRKTKEEEEAIVRQSYAILEKVGLNAMVNELAKNLPYGDQRRLEIARALATDPFLLLLDEPAAGMNPMETMGLANLIRGLRDEGNLTILLIEHDMRLVMNLCDRIYVLDYGEKIAEGTPEEVRTNPQVIRAYLGEECYA